MSKKPTMASQLVEARARIAELECQLEGNTANKIEKLEHRIEELERDANQHESDRLDEEAAVEFTREQIDLLATDADTVSAPTTPEQWRRCLKGILAGTDWRYGTWK